MKTLITAIILCGLAGSVVAQKKKMFLGTMVIGEVVGTVQDTREVTIKYPGKEGTETFTGILADTYKLNINEITPGARVKVIYKTKQQDIGGPKKEINSIFQVDFLGKDEFSRLRGQLDVDPSMVIMHSKDDHLPSLSPLKVFVSIGYDATRPSLVDWITTWNSKHKDSYDKLELVYDLNKADVLMVIAYGSDTMIRVQTADYVDDSVVRTEFSQATLYLVLKDAEGLKILWTSVAPVMITNKTAVLSRSKGLILSEMEKRMKTRSSSLKK
jgi:hypothetical protein